MCVEFEVPTAAAHGHTRKDYEKFFEDLRYEIVTVYRPEGVSPDEYGDYTVMPR